MRAVEEGTMDRNSADGSLDRCLLCRACETACPSGVEYGPLLEEHRAQSRKGLLELFAHFVLVRRWLLSPLTFALRSAQNIGLFKLAGRFGTTRMRALAGAVPKNPSRFVPRAGTTYPATEPHRGVVGLHLGCVNAELFGSTLEATIKLFTAQGFEVIIPPQPTCCGALHVHTGDPSGGAQLARNSWQATQDHWDAWIVPAAGCAAQFADHPKEGTLEAQDPLVFLARRGLRGNPRTISRSVAYDPPCHLSNVLNSRGEVEAVLDSVPGLERMEFPEASLCCGAGGISFAREPESANEVTDRKKDHLQACGADSVLSGNPGCLMRLQDALPAEHPILIVAEAYEPETK